MEIRYISNYGFTDLQDPNIEVLNSRQILTYQRRYNQGIAAGITDAELNTLAEVDTDWLDVYFGTGTSMNHNLTLTSGSETSSNFTSIGYFKQEGILLNSDLQRFNVRNNFNGRSNNGKFRYGLNLSLNYSETNEVDGAGSGSTFFNPYTAALAGLPYLSAVNPDGSPNITGGITPGDINAITANDAANFVYVNYNSLSLNVDEEQEIKMLAALNASYDINDQFTIGIVTGMDFSSEKGLDALNPNSILGPFQTGFNGAAEFGGLQTESYRREFRFNNQLSLMYNQTFSEKHTVSAGLYTEYNKAHLYAFNFTQQGIDPRLFLSGAGFIDGTITEPINGDDVNPYIPTVGSAKLEEGLFSYFGTADYDYDGRYGVSATLRRDSSFRFQDENEWGTFYSVGARWNINEEDFMSDTDFNLLKLRGSYGIQGNQRISNAEFGALNLTRSLYGVGGQYNSTPGTVVTQIGVPSLRWEDVKSANIGIDFGVWNNKLNGSFDVYSKITEDLYQGNPVSPVNATTTLQTNIGSLENKGVELSLNYNIFSDKDWFISVGVNGSYNENRITELPASFEGINTAGGSTANATDQPINVYFVVPYLGVNPANGNPLFQDINGNITETISDSDRRITGKAPVPVWQGGFSSTFRYKGFELSSQWAFVADIDRNNLDLASLEESFPSGGRNRSVTILNEWREVGDITSIPRAFSPFGSVDYINSTDRYLEDASYLRLRNVTLGYQFQPEMLDRIFLTSARVFVQAENLLTFTGYKGLDPEGGYRTTDRGVYPTPRIVTVGTTLTF